MDYSAANHQLWNFIIQTGYIAAVILIARGKRNHTAPAVPPDVFPDELNGQGPDDPENEI